MKPGIRPWRGYFRRFRGLQGALIGSVFLAMARAAALLPIALLVRHIFNVLIPQSNWSGLLFLSLIIFGLHICSAGVALLNRYLTLTISKRAIQIIRVDLLHRLVYASRDFYARSDHSALHDNIVHDTERLDIMTNALITLLIPSMIIGGVMTGVLVYLNPLLCLAVLTVTPLLYITGRLFGQVVKRSVRLFNQEFERFSDGILHVLNVFDTMKLKGAEEIEFAEQAADRLGLPAGTRCPSTFPVRPRGAAHLPAARIRRSHPRVGHRKPGGLHSSLGETGVRFAQS